MTALSMLVTTVLAIDDDDLLFRRLNRRLSRSGSGAVTTAVPRVLFLQVDGLGHAVFQRAVRNGNLPTLGGRLSAGTHRLTAWETDAIDAVLTMSVAGKRKGGVGAGYYAYFSQPYNTTRTLLAALAEVTREVFQATAQRRRDVIPRVHRGGVFPLLRAFTTVVSRDVTVATLIGDMQAGRSGF
jgi:hypothetical protein